MFDKTLQLLLKYRTRYFPIIDSSGKFVPCDISIGGRFLEDLFTEILVKTDHLQFIILRVKQLEKNINDQMSNTEMQVLTEAFYNSAFRILDIVYNNDFKGLPNNIKNSCVGVRDVRNQLIVHPDKKNHSKVTMPSFGWGSGGGPVIKAARRVGQEDVFVDRGLYKNAEEFNDFFCASLQRAITLPE